MAVNNNKNQPDKCSELIYTSINVRREGKQLSLGRGKATHL